MSNTIPSLSIAMTTYNGEKFLHQQIESILDQSYKDFELIICDDMSSDTTIDIIRSYMKDHPNIKLYKNTQRLGSVKNFEKAIRLCDQRYIAISDQDDIWAEDKLEILINKMQEIENTEGDIPIMIHSDLKMIDENNKTIERSYFKFRRYTLKNEKNLNHILGPCGVMGNTVLMNRSLKKLVLPFPAHLNVHDYWIALINEIYGKRVTLDQTLVQYRIHEKNLSNSMDNLNIHQLNTYTAKFNLPYMGIGREKVLRTLLLKHDIPKEDILMIKKFLTYLDFRINRLHIFYTLVAFNFIKKGFFYRLKLFLKIIFSQKQHRERTVVDL